MRATNKAIVLVDPRSTGSYLLYHFRAHGYQCVRVATSFSVPSTMAHKSKIEKNQYIETLQMSDNSIEEVNKIVEKLSKYKILAVIAASEPGVIIADQIADHFNVMKNDKLSSHRRRHKYDMIDALKKFGLLTQKQFISSNMGDLIEWYTHSGLKKIVLKPPLSTSSEGVYICRNVEEIEKNFHKILGQPNFYNHVSNEVVAQEYLVGDEYIVNTVSHNGLHFVVDIWRGVGQKQDKISCDDYAEFMGGETQEYQVLSNYVVRVLDALGIKNGAAHSEIRYTNNGPYLIETGARLAGEVDPSAMIEIQGYSQAFLTAQVILNPLFFDKVFLQLLKNEPRKIRYARHVYFSANISGIIKNEPDFTEMFQLDSLHSIYFAHNVGDELEITSETLGRPGYGFLLSNDKDQLEQDYLRFRILEEHFYKNLLK
jgi:carbamoylphosphate synthase large subunit